MSSFIAGASGRSLDAAFEKCLQAIADKPNRRSPSTIQLVDSPPLTMDMDEFVQMWLERLSVGEAIAWTDGLDDLGQTQYQFLGKFEYI